MKRPASASSEIAVAQRRARPRPIDAYLGQAAGRDAGIALAYLEGGHTQTAIARVAGLSVSRVSRLVRAHEAKGKT